MLRTLFAAAVALVVVAGQLRAQGAGTFEIGGFGRFSIFDGSLRLSDRPGGGGWLGLFFARNLSVEGDASYTQTESLNVPDVTSYIPIHARLVYSLPLHNIVSILIGAGYVHNEFGRNVNQSDDGATGLIGLKGWMSDNFYVRGEGTLDYIPDPANMADQNWNWGVQFGVGIVFGPGASRDTDGDGVGDRSDACRDTPTGQAVDELGCPQDSDADGVADPSDDCTNTPIGTQVDGRGCPVDSDGDGVADPSDQCPNTRVGETVDATGCPRDADGDGVADSGDRCPGTPAGVPVEEDGCPKDSDGDGVSDASDRCPNSLIGAEVNADGCPRDGDTDGVPDGIDRCPNTAQGTEVDDTGCPVLFREGATSVILQGVTFATNSARLTSEAMAVLNPIAQTLVANPNMQVEVAGFTDNTGPYVNNLRLSQQRADAVKAYLVQQGVTATRMQARGYGPGDPVASNATRDGRATNRRVELRRTGG